MWASSIRRLASAVALVILFSFVQVAFATDILIGDAKSQPESLTMAPGGVLIVGSAIRHTFITVFGRGAIFMSGDGCRNQAMAIFANADLP